MGGIMTCYTKDTNYSNLENEKPVQEINLGGAYESSLAVKRNGSQNNSNNPLLDANLQAQHNINMNWQIYSITENPEIDSIQNEFIRVALVKGDITLEKTTALLIDTNESLNMNSFFQNLLKDKGASKIQEECNQIIETEGRIRIGNAIFTKPGDLLCQTLMHFVVPSQGFEQEELFYKKIENSYKNCFIQADQNNIKSLTIPLYVNTNNTFQLIDKFLKILANSIQQFLETKSHNSLIYIRIFNLNLEKTNEFAKDFEYIKHVL